MRSKGGQEVGICFWHLSLSRLPVDGFLNGPCVGGPDACRLLGARASVREGVAMDGSTKGDRGVRNDIRSRRRNRRPHPRADRALVQRCGTCRDERVQSVKHIPGHGRRTSGVQMPERLGRWSQGLSFRMESVPDGEVVLACIYLIALLALFALAGTSDWMAEQAYQRTWARENGIEMEETP